MQFMKRLGLFLAIPLLGLSVFLGVLLWSLQHYFGATTNLKLWLVESQVYPAVRSELIAQTAKGGGLMQSGEITLTNAVLKRALEAAVTDQVLQSTAENALDGVHAWLIGDTEKPVFVIDVDPIKKAFADSVSQSATARLKKLPDCVLIDQAITTDPFSVNCNPPTATRKKELKQVRDEIINSKEFLPQDITADAPNIDETAKEKTQVWYEQVANLPTIYQWTMRGPIIALVLGLASAIIIVFAGDTRRGGLKRASITVLTASLALVVSSVILLAVLRSVQLPVETDTAALGEPLVALTRLIANAVTRWQLFVSIGLTAISSVCLLWLHLTREKTPPAPTKPTKPNLAASK